MHIEGPMTTGDVWRQRDANALWDTVQPYETMILKKSWLNEEREGFGVGAQLGGGLHPAVDRDWLSWLNNY